MGSTVHDSDLGCFSQFVARTPDYVLVQVTIMDLSVRMLVEYHKFERRVHTSLCTGMVSSKKMCL